MSKGHWIALLALTTAGCGPGELVFEQNAEVAPAVLYGAFEELPHTGSALAAIDINDNTVRIEHAGEHDLLMTVPSSESGKDSIFKLHFACRETCAKTALTVTINVPSERIGTNQELDANKVQQYFRQYTQMLIKAKEQGESTEPAAREFAGMFDALRMITNPQIRSRIKSMAQAAGEPIPSFVDDNPGPPPGFGQDHATADAPTPPSGNRDSSYQAWVREAARDDEAAKEGPQDEVSR